MLKAIHAQESLDAAREKAGRIVEQLHAMRLRKAAEWLEENIEETLSYYRYPQTHWTRIKPITHWNASCGKSGAVLE